MLPPFPDPASPRPRLHLPPPLTPASVVVRRENSDALGPGFRCGFLGMLHMEIFTQRLEQEFGAAVVTTTPMVPYSLQMPDGSEVTLESAADFPLDKKVGRQREGAGVIGMRDLRDLLLIYPRRFCHARPPCPLLPHSPGPCLWSLFSFPFGLLQTAPPTPTPALPSTPHHQISAILEPTVTATLITPDASVGRLMELCAARRGEPLEHSSLGGGRTLLRYRLPLAELAGDFYSAVKSRSQG